MPPVVVAGGVIIPNTVQTVFQRMIINLMDVQIIPNRIRITEHINILIFPQIYGHKRSLQLSHQPGELHPREHIQQKIPLIPVIGRKLREKALFLFPVGKHLLKQSRLHGPLLQCAEIIGQRTQEQAGLPPDGRLPPYRQIQFL